MRRAGKLSIAFSATVITCLNNIHGDAFSPPRPLLHTKIIIGTSTSITPPAVAVAVAALSMGFLDDLFNNGNGNNNNKNNNNGKKTPTVTLPPDFQIPEPKPLSITRPSFIPSALKSSLALAIRLATGAFVLGWQIDTLTTPPSSDEEYALSIGPFNIRDSSPILATAPRPTQTLILYEYDSSPYCKRVREIINLLDLTVEYRPCPGARQSRFSEELFERTGRRTVPYLIDPNTDTEMFESDDQIRYLIDTYGPDPSLYDAKALWPITFTSFSIYTSSLAAVIRGMPSSRRQPNARPDNEDMIPLELWGYECSPFVKPVREKLGSLALPHRIVSCSRGSANRDRMMEKVGRFQVPFLVDGNTGVELFESAEILDYLEACYTVKKEEED